MFPQTSQKGDFMNHNEIISHLSVLDVNPSEIIYSITMETILSAIVQRLGEDALTLSLEDLHLAREEVKEALNHNLDERDYIDMGLDSWEIIRNL
ncbi:hypothetical protein Ppro_3559 [Pelobacter propionicus DSM 2379]|uniref:Uncharacterized protein n=2 Tax=Pelobacter propionicus TaxID=29543 RepID=A1AUY0_PELPD|nr:hypothetical protein Ppro_3559 [Pelobacter propionicus DSM 2379]